MSGRLSTAWCWVTVWWRRTVAWLREESLAILIVLAFAAPTIYLAVRSSRAADALASQFDGTCDALAQPNLDEQLALDYVFIFYFAATVVVGLFLWWRNDAPAWSRHRLGLITPLILWFLTDLAENVAIHNARAWCAQGGGDPGWRGDLVYALATGKWVLFGIVVVGLLYQIGWRTNRPKPPPQKRCEPAQSGGTGICCSGGGIRSASFSLGALHGLGRERLRTARYLAAVSGGGYAAAGMTIRAAAEPKVGRLPFSEGSDELERLRARTSYLGLNGQDGRVAVARALATIAFNLLILYLVVFAIGRPLGWIIQSEVLHPELRAATPLLYDVRIDPLPGDDDISIRSTSEPAALAPRCAPETVTEQYWTISLSSGYVVRYAERETAQERDLAPRQDELVVSPGQLNICDGLPTLAVQPRLFVGEDSPARIEGAPAYFVETQISVRVADGNVAPLGRNEVRQLVEIATKPSVKVRPPSDFTVSITIDGWMWGVVAVPFLLASLMLALNVSTIRGKTGGTLKLSLSIQFLVFVSALTGLVGAAPFRGRPAELATRGRDARRQLNRRPTAVDRDGGGQRRAGSAGREPYRDRRLEDEARSAAAAQGGGFRPSRYRRSSDGHECRSAGCFERPRGDRVGLGPSGASGTVHDPRRWLVGHRDRRVARSQAVGANPRLVAQSVVPRPAGLSLPQIRHGRASRDARSPGPGGG